MSLSRSLNLPPELLSHLQRITFFSFLVGGRVAWKSPAAFISSFSFNDFHPQFIASAKA